MQNNYIVKQENFKTCVMLRCCEKHRKRLCLICCYCQHWNLKINHCNIYLVKWNYIPPNQKIKRKSAKLLIIHQFWREGYWDLGYCINLLQVCKARLPQICCKWKLLSWFAANWIKQSISLQQICSKFDITRVQLAWQACCKFGVWWLWGLR